MNEMDKTRDLYRMFFPNSVGIIGASPNLEKHNGAFVERAIKYGYPKESIYLVNPKYAEIFGLPCYKSVKDVPIAPDVVFIIVPAELVPEVLRECGEKGVGNAVVISAGFKEVGGDGIEREKKLLEIADEFNVNLLGPNCPGFISPKIHLCMTTPNPEPGGLVLISQSGGITVSMVNLAKKTGAGCRLFVGIGNKPQIDEIELLKAFSQDERLLTGTKVMALHLESVERPKEFTEVAQKLKEKAIPLIVFKSGESEAGKKAAGSHTGAMATPTRVNRALFKKAGVILAADIEEFIYSALAFGNLPSVEKGEEGIAILTNSGGTGVLMADALEKRGLKPADFSEETKTRLKSVLEKHSAFCAVSNPVDIIGGGTPEFFYEATKELLARPEVNTLIIVTPGSPFEKTDSKIAEKISRAYQEVRGADKKPLFVTIMAEISPEIRTIYRTAGLPVFFSPNTVANIIALMAEYKELSEKETEAAPKFDANDKAAIAEILKREQDKPACRVGRYLSGLDAEFALGTYGLKFPKTALAIDADGAWEFCLELRKSGAEKAVLKIESPDIIHKSDIGGVMVGVPLNKEKIYAAFNELVGIAVGRGARVTGALVQEMVESGKEVLLGVKKEPGFGHLIAFGEGGIYAESRNDVAYRLAPLSRKEAKEMIEEIKFFKILKGARGEKQTDFETLADMLLRISRLVGDFPEISELDINPVRIVQDRFICLDARIKIE